MRVIFLFMTGLVALLFPVYSCGPLRAQDQQNPSPMIEHTRSHPRLKKQEPPGRRVKLSVGTLFLPDKLKLDGKAGLFVHFHGASWLAEVAAERNDMAVVSVQSGTGSGVYARAFASAEKFANLLKEAETLGGVKFGLVGLSAWSAGYGAVREILKNSESYKRVQFVLLLDGLHAAYVNGKPGPKESQLVAENLEVFVKFARDAVAEKKQMIVTHTEIFPGTYASTTETADYLLAQLGLPRQATLKWGPLQTQQLSEVRKGKFLLLGYAGNSAPDHVDQLYALPDYLKLLECRPGGKSSK